MQGGTRMTTYRERLKAGHHDAEKQAKAEAKASSDEKKKPDAKK